MAPIKFTYITRSVGCSHLSFFSRYGGKEQKSIFKLFLVLGFKDTFRIIVLDFLCYIQSLRET